MGQGKQRQAGDPGASDGSQQQLLQLQILPQGCHVEMWAGGRRREGQDRHPVLLSLCQRPLLPQRGLAQLVQRRQTQLSQMLADGQTGGGAGGVAAGRVSV